MKYSRWKLRSAVATTAGLAVAAALPAGLASAQSTSSAGGPMAKLIVAQQNINVPLYGNQAYIDPGVYVVAVGSQLRFNVQRSSYATPITVTQILRGPDGTTVRRPLPDWTADGWQGLRRFVSITVKNTAGKVVASQVGPFCPNSFNPQRSNPNAPASSPFPMLCQLDPFQLSNAWGIQRGWGVDAGSINPRLQLGKYIVTVKITPAWQRLLHLTARTSTATVNINVVKASGCLCAAPRQAIRHQTSQGVLPKLPTNVPILSNPPASELPDLVPLPSWGITTNTFKTGTTSTDVLSFGATVWIGGHSRLDVEGFRSNGSPTMPAWQYFWKNGRIIGRARAGTMGFDSQPGHDHWHFEQFAQYRLLNASKSLALRSAKVGFCIAPTDPVSLLLPHALWQPTSIGFTGTCGYPSALWVQEMLPLGWGDTYQQFLPGQAFDINNLPNGTYYIEIIANPLHVLHESNYRNDISLRKIILGGTPGHRTVLVPAIHGIDPEGSSPSPSPSPSPSASSSPSASPSATP